ncbi:MAG: hypothetical protein JWQ62_918 [Lacunisphaera sp.]|jgi:hypothetical protein|nr:hypothetical protein [Lacunisphaera sp.]
MKPLPRLLLFLAASLMVAGPSPGAANPPATPERPLAERIDALLRPHLKPTPLPITLPNPFIVVHGTADFTGDTPTARVAGPDLRRGTIGPAGLSDPEKLAQAVTKLRIGGTIKVNDVTHLIVNQVPYREGATFMAEGKDEEILLQIVRLRPDELVLGFKDATQAIRLKNAPRTAEPEK